MDAKGNPHEAGTAAQRETLARFLLACRTPFLRDLPLLLNALFDKLDDALYDLADKAGNDLLYTRYFDSTRVLRKQSHNIKASFLRQLELASELKPHRLTEHDTRALDGLRLEDFALVEEGDLEESLAVSNLVSKAENRYYRQLHELGRLMGGLLGRRELSPRSNPLGPVAICDAFGAAIRPVQDIDLSIKLVVYKLFDKQVMDHLGDIYDQCLTLAARQGLAPTSTPRRTLSERMAALPSFEDVSSLRPAPPQAAKHAVDAALGRIPFEELRALLDHWRAPRPAGADAAPGEMMVMQTSELMVILTNLQTVPRPARPGLIATENLRARIDGAVHAPRPNGASVRHSLGDVDKDTLDLVFLLFESILQGGNLPDPIKALVGRLQIPYVKVALLDKTFFQNQEHPARRLLNRIGDASMGWTDDEDRSPTSLYGRIEQIVARIIGKFDRDLSLFERLDAELAAYLAGEAVKVGAAEAHVCSMAARRDRSEAARHQAEAVIAERLEQTARIPPVVVSLLHEGWREVLASAYLSGGEGGREWHNALAVMDRLIWSVQPKVSNEDRRELLRGVPELLRTLRSGMTPVALDQRVLARWFRELQALHLTALRAPPQSQPAPMPPPTGSPTRPPVPDRADSGPRSTGVASADGGAVNQALRLEPGVWVELLRDDAQRVRVKLAWVSSDGQRMQFVDRLGREGPQMARGDLATLLEYGLATIVHGDTDLPLVDRAVVNLSRTLSH